MQLHELKAHPVIKWLAYAGFSLIIISFIFFYGWGQSVDQQQQRDTAVARFESDDALKFLPWRKWEYIQASEVLPAWEEVAQQKIALLGPQFAQLLRQQGIDEMRFATQEEAARQAMDTRLLLAEAERLGLVVPMDEVDAYIRQVTGSAQNLNALLQGQGMTLDELRRRLQRQQTALRAQNYIANQSRTSLYELWLEYLLVNEKITLDLASYPVAEYEDKVEVSEADLQAYLGEHKERFEIPAKRRYAYVKVSKEDLKAEIEPTEDQLKAYYEQNTADFREPESVQFEDVLAPVNADQPTTAAQALITAYSDALTTGAQWGEDLVDAMRDLNPDAQLYYRPSPGWVARDDEARAMYGPQLLDRVFSLSNDQISTPVQSPSGYSLLKRTDYKPEGMKPFEDVRDEVAEAFKEEKAGEQLQEEAARLRAELETKRYNNMRDFAQSVQLEDKLTTEVLANDAMIPEVGSLFRDRNYLINLKPGRLSGLFDGGDFFAVLEVKDEQPARDATLDEVREEVTAAVKAQKARELAKAAAERALNEIQTGAEFATATADSPTTTVQTAPFTRDETVADLGFPLIEFREQSSRIDQGSTGLSAYGPSRENPAGYAIWKVASVESPTKDDFRRDRRQFEAEYLQLKRLTIIEEWLADKRNEVEFQLLNEPEEAEEAAPEPDEERQTAQANP